MGRHRSDPRGLGRYLLLGVVAVVAITLVVVGVMSLRGALSSKKPPHTPTPTSQRGPQTHPAVETSSSVLLIKIIHVPCHVFVKDPATGDILQSENADLRLGAMLRYVEAPLQVQINDPACVQVFVHGRSRPSPARRPWIFMLDS